MSERRRTIGVRIQQRSVGDVVRAAGRLFVEGDPKNRVFTGDPLAYAGRHRREILGEFYNSEVF